MGNSALDKTNFAASDLQIPSQVQGDMLYFDGSNWVKLAKGTALQQLRTNAGLTAPEWATISSGYTNIKRTNLTRDRSTASNTVSYTGFGFEPKLIFVNASMVTENNINHSTSQHAKVGAVLGSTSMTRDGNVNAYDGGIAWATFRKNGGDHTGSVLDSMDSDGVTVTWEQIGSVTGELRMQVLALG